MPIFNKCLHSIHPSVFLIVTLKSFQLRTVKGRLKKKKKEFKSFKSSSLVSDPLKIPAQQIKCLATLLKKI